MTEAFKISEKKTRDPHALMLSYEDFYFRGMVISDISIQLPWGIITSLIYIILKMGGVVGYLFTVTVGSN